MIKYYNAYLGTLHTVTMSYMHEYISVTGTAISRALQTVRLSYIKTVCLELSRLIVISVAVLSRPSDDLLGMERHLLFGRFVCIRWRCQVS